MRIPKLLLICVCCLIAVLVVWGQVSSNPTRPGILGYLDPHTGAFRPVPPAVTENAELPAATVYTGTVTLTITVTLKTAVITNVTCSAIVYGGDGTSTFTQFSESDVVTGFGTGSTRTCRLKVPYSWSLTSASADTMTTEYTVTGTTGTAGLPQRTAGRAPFDSRAIPANGATTALTAAVTI